MENIKREITFVVKGNSYQIKFPNVGQYLDIENLKIVYSRDKYAGFLSAVTKTAYKALDFIDMFANLQILCPQLCKDLKADNFLEMDIFDVNELLKEYKTQIDPWIDSWQKLLQNPTEIVKE